MDIDTLKENFLDFRTKLDSEKNYTLEQLEAEAFLLLEDTIQYLEQNPQTLNRFNTVFLVDAITAIGTIKWLHAISSFMSDYFFAEEEVYSSDSSRPNKYDKITLDQIKKILKKQRINIKNL